MKVYLLIFSFIVLSISGFSQVDDSQARAILNKVSAKAKAYTNMKFQFSYILTDPKHKINDTIEGTIVMAGSKFNLDFMGKKIISNGTTVWTYDQEAQEIQISNVKADDETLNPSKMLTAYDASFRSRLIKTVTEKGKVYHIIDLYPKKSKAYHRIRLKIDKAEMRVVEGSIFNKDGVTYTYKVKKFTPNVTLAANYFTFDVKKYPDAEIIDLR